MNPIQKVRSGLTEQRILWGMTSICLFSAAWFVWTLPDQLAESRVEMDVAERTEAVAKAFSRSSSLFSLLCMGGSFAGYKAMNKRVSNS